MVANITSGANYYGLLAYHQDKIDKQEAKIIYEHNILDSKPRNLHNYLDSISRYTNTKKPVFHVSLSFPKKDLSKLSDEALNKISQDYLDEMGYGKQPYIIYRHYDKEHPHVHVVSTRVNIETQKSIPSKFEGRRSQKITENLEQKYTLTIAKYQTPIHKTIQEDLRKALQGAPINLNRLNKNLTKNKSEYRAKTVGKGLVYFKVDGTGKKSSKTWKSSKFKNIGLDKKGLEKQFSINLADRKLLKKEILPVLNNSISPSLTRIKSIENVKNVENQLERKGIQINYAKNEHEVFGWSFKYKDKNFKASDIDSSLSWNKWKEHFQVSTINDAKTISKNTSPKIGDDISKNIEKSIQSGEKISVNFKDNRYQFKVGEKGGHLNLEKQLHSMDNEDAYQVTKIHNKGVEDYGSAPSINEKKLIGQLAGIEAEDYLQRQYNNRQKRLERSMKKRR